ncbi:PREDICTED: zinc finger FYVE domain-containing protein 9 isoform X2 [Nicrophorus vespilloides]|uniref:Zinc finger FYVE domain-containing protein 9 isoform X2 n=1 Tax=Nicrophorus vespilloides TaxID=110193 RepID=A0ABM1N3I0_NICVS|nr:PREDICTED: zinc finger FYVE domain-containing protein 9 isoform X2 [Nicrophorus vespilloides]
MQEKLSEMMDKYTVDLDKVLNDFEYSELTADSQVTTPSVSVESRKHIGPTKHSMNNVFSSLNEYLNTGKFDTAEAKQDRYQTSSIHQTTKASSGNDEHYTNWKQIANESTAACQNESVVKSEQNFKEVLVEPTVAESVVKCDEVKSEDCKNKSDGSFVDLDVKSCIKSEESENASTLNLVQICDNKNIIETSEIQSDNEISGCKPDFDVISKPHNVINNYMEDYCLINEVNTVDEQQAQKDELEEDNIDKPVLNDLKSTDVVDTAIDESYEVEIIHDSDLSKDSQLSDNNCNANTEIVDDNNIIQDSDVSIKEAEIPLKEQETADSESIPNDLALHNEVVEDINNQEELNIQECTECVDNTNNNNPVCFNNSLDIDDEELQNYLDKIEEEFGQENVKTEEVVNTAEPEQVPETAKEPNISEEGNANRPNSLDIEKREINLIGNPGSTPYNNLYVSKEISEDYDESTTSSSVSPAFSDASTGSVRSTDTTTDEGVKDIAVAEGEEAAAKPTEEESRAADHMDDIYIDIDKINNMINPTEGEASASAASTSETQELENPDAWLGKRAPVWVPDDLALHCLHCNMKFTVIKRRHHCRACGFVLCSKCCNSKHRLEYLDMEARVCTRCYDILSKLQNETTINDVNSDNSTRNNKPNPNNPMEYCSVVPPLQQIAAGGGDANPPSVMVPVGVLKRKGSNKAKHNKSVMFCDGIKPGSDLTNLDNDFNYNGLESKPQQASSSKKPQSIVLPKANRNVPALEPKSNSFIAENESCLPPTVTTFKSDISYTECANNVNVVEMLKNETLTFAIQRNLHVHVRLISMDCCVNKQAWCFSTEGLISVGQDEIVILLEYMEGERSVPKDVFYHLNNIYNDAVKGTTVGELGLSIHPTTNFLDSKNHAGFIFIRPTFQCLQNVIIPKESYLIGILVHRWETPWAKNFPLRLVLRLGAEYRYYPSPIISTRHRDSVFVEIGHTIINLLADFRQFTYTLPSIRGLTIHMEDKNTTVTIPVNRYDQVMKSISNSSEHILAFGGNFSLEADSHLVCIQDTNGSNENNYTTHAINIQNKPRKVTGTSFIVFNGALKSSSGLTAKSSIVEDGLMIQIPPEHMIQVRENLKEMKNHTIHCGCVNADSDESVSIIWGDRDTNFNIGVKSSIDDQSLAGVPSIRVHNGKNFSRNSGERMIRWTEVFLLQSGEENARTQDPIDVSKIAESISKATCLALVKYLNLLATNNFYKIGIRTTLHIDNVSYSAGSNGIKLPPIYMKSLDNELVPVLHRITSNNLGESAIILELVFRILNV